MVPSADSAEETKSSRILRVKLRGVKSEKPDNLLCALWTKPDGFPKESDRADQRTAAVRNGKEWTCTFSVEKHGKVAVAVVHDENKNQKLDTNLFGAPTEGWGTTRNVTHTFKAPTFEKSAIELKGPDTSIEVVMHY